MYKLQWDGITIKTCFQNLKNKSHMYFHVVGFFENIVYFKKINKNIVYVYRNYLQKNVEIRYCSLGLNFKLQAIQAWQNCSGIGGASSALTWHLPWEPWRHLLVPGVHNWATKVATSWWRWVQVPHRWCNICVHSREREEVRQQERKPVPFSIRGSW